MGEPFDPAKLKALHEAAFNHMRLDVVADYMLEHAATICALASRVAELEGKLAEAQAQLLASDTVASEFWDAYKAMQKLSEKHASTLAYGIFARVHVAQKKGPTP